MQNTVRGCSLAVAVFVLAGFSEVVSAQTSAPIPTESADVAKRQAEIDKLNAERDKLLAESAYFSKAQWFSLAQNGAGFLAIVISIVIAGRQITAQHKAQQVQADENSKLLDLRAKVDATLKAAEIAMNAPTTGQLRSRAKLLAALLNDLVPNFGEKLTDLDYDKIGFASHRARFLTLLESIASHPEEAKRLTEIYFRLFPQDDKNSGGNIAKLLEFLEPNGGK